MTVVACSDAAAAGNVARLVASEGIQAGRDQKRSEEKIGQDLLLEAEQDKGEGNACYKRGEFAAATAKWTSALQKIVEAGRYVLLPPRAAALETSLYLNLAQGHLKSGHFGRAERACQVVLREDPSSEKALFRLGEAQVELGKLDEVARTIALLKKEAEGTSSSTTTTNTSGQQLAATLQQRLSQKIRAAKAEQRSAKEKERQLALRIMSKADEFAVDDAELEKRKKNAPGALPGVPSGTWFPEMAAAGALNKMKMNPTSSSAAKSGNGKRNKASRQAGGDEEAPEDPSMDLHDCIRERAAGSVIRYGYQKLAASKSNKSGTEQGAGDPEAPSQEVVRPEKRSSSPSDENSSAPPAFRSTPPRSPTTMTTDHGSDPPPADHQTAVDRTAVDRALAQALRYRKAKTRAQKSQEDRISFGAKLFYLRNERSRDQFEAAQKDFRVGAEAVCDVEEPAEQAEKVAPDMEAESASPSNSYGDDIVVDLD